MLLRLYEHHVLGIIEEEGQFQAFFPDGLTVAAILGDQQDELLAIEQVQQSDEALATPLNPEGICVGERFYVAPSVLPTPVPPGRLHLRIDATQAFGTGRHESTQLMLEYVEKELRPQQFVLDVGSGSGILSQAVRLLGAHEVVACDIDEVAVAQGKSANGVPAFVGSVDAIRSEIVDLLLVNISARVIDDLAAQLQRVLKPSGVLVASGFIRNRVPQRLKPRAVTELDDWLCWVCDRESIVADAGDAQRVLRHAPNWW